MLAVAVINRLACKVEVVLHEQKVKPLKISLIVEESEKGEGKTQASTTFRITDGL